MNVGSSRRLSIGGLGPLLTGVALLGGCGDPDWIMYSPMDFLGAPTEYDDAQAPQRLSAAAVSMMAAGDVETNLDGMAMLAQRILDAQPDVQVIVFPELATGWSYDSSDPAGYQQGVAQTTTTTRRCV